MVALLLFCFIPSLPSIFALPSQDSVLRPLGVGNSTRDDVVIPPAYATSLRSQIYCTDEPEAAKVDARFCDAVLNELRHDKDAGEFIKYESPGDYEFSPLPCAINLVPISRHAPPIELSFSLVAGFAYRILADCSVLGQGGSNRLFNGWYLTVDGGAVEWPRRVNASTYA